ncbi:MAG: type 2 isopentenyl-diphosphate Delta-isomerase [Dehalococcoidia bacterium]
MTDDIARRKQDHLDVVRDQDVTSALSAGWERFRFVHDALPDIDLADVSLAAEAFGKRLAAPLLLSSMTGGTPETAAVNRRLASVAQHLGLAMGVGSQRIALQAPRDVGHFAVRDIAPDILLFANLGAVQLNYGFTPGDCAWLVQSLGADALILHLNPLQEALQEGGDTRFGGLIERIGEVCRALTVPVVVKEVGWGLSARVSEQLAAAGVAGIDVAGAGGTSWSEVERHRATDPLLREVAAAFRGWGIPTAEALIEVRAALPGGFIIASGGIANGVDAAKALALGADLCGLAAPVIQAALRSEDDAEFALRVVIEQLRVAMFAAGISTVPAMRTAPGLLREVVHD